LGFAFPEKILMPPVVLIAFAGALYFVLGASLNKVTRNKAPRTKH